MAGWKSRAGLHDHSDDMVDVEVTLMDESELAWHVSDGQTRAWIPKSKCRDNGDGSFSIPEWMAKQKGLI